MVPINNGVLIFNYTPGAIRYLKIWNYLNEWPDLTELHDHIRNWWTLNIIDFDKNTDREIRTVDMTESFKDILMITRSGNEQTYIIGER